MSDEDQVDDELVELREIKGKLLTKAINLRREFDDWEKSQEKSYSWTEKDFIPTRSEFQELLNQNDNTRSVNKKCVAVSSFMMGIKFNAVDKKWIGDHKFVYTSNVRSKALDFFLEVTVNAKDADKSLKILEIVCHFVNVRKCYSLEITPWVHQFTEAKDMSNLFSAMSDYTEHNVTRTKILRKFLEYNIASAQEYTEADGGIMVSLHAKDDAEFVYFEIRWVLKFVESLWRIDNFFVIQPISAGEDFMAANNEVLQSFCKYGLKKDDLQDMWDKLCSAIERDEPSHSTTGTTDS